MRPGGSLVVADADPHLDRYRDILSEDDLADPRSAPSLQAASEQLRRAVVATCDADNLASILTLNCIGFRRTGEEGGRVLWRYSAHRLGH